MIIVTIIRVSGLHDRHAKAIDVVWEFHWQWVEACVAITMVSLTAFRSFFVQHNSRNNSPPKRPWYAGVKAIMTGRGSEDKKEAVREWPKIPGGTMTGMRTFIDGRGNEVEEDVLPLHHEQRNRQGIVVQHDLSSMSEGKVRLSSYSLTCQGLIYGTVFCFHRRKRAKKIRLSHKKPEARNPYLESSVVKAVTAFRCKFGTGGRDYGNTNGGRNSKIQNTYSIVCVL